ncbi:MAG TPA: DUF58 domain-containing protein [Tepidisphaeraceae bacterium]|nr:DUF58 domain-containing protein [Tepidisphaeraceae bacterium]
MSSAARYLDPNLIQRLNKLSLTARRIVEGTAGGLHRSQLKGASVEFRQHRSYVAGDEPRRIDWRVLARTDRHYIREFQEETNLRAAILMDRSGSLSYGSRLGSKYEYGARATAALAYLMLAQAESVGLAMFGNGIEQWLKPQSYRIQLSRIIELLENGRPAGYSDPAAAMHGLADRLERRSLVILVSDLFAPIPRIREGLARLRYERHEVIVMQVLDPDEIQFPFRGFFRFNGLEGERSSLIDAVLLRNSYLRNFKRHQEQLKVACRTLGVEFAQLTTDLPLDSALVWFLTRRLQRG